MRDLAINLIAAGIAFLLGVLAKSARDKYKTRRTGAELGRRLKRGNPGYTTPWIVAYYERCGRGEELYESTRLFPGHKLQFLVRPTWIFDSLDDGSLLIQDHPQHVIDAGLNKRALKRRGHAIKSASGDDWNDYHSCALGVLESASGPRIKVGLCRYLEYLSVSGALEDETFRAIERRSKRTPLRDQGFASVDAAAGIGLHVHSIGMVTALIYMDGGTPMVLIQRRSERVSTYAGALGVVPMFSCQTRDLTPQTTISLNNNFLRELYEELYGGVEAQAASVRATKDWYESADELSRYVGASARENLRIVGFGFDARNGQLIIGSIYVIDDPDFARVEVPRMRGNWEISHIDIVALRGAVIQDLLLRDQFTPACAFTLMRALEMLS